MLKTVRVDLDFFFFFSSRRRHTRWTGDWSSDVCSSDLVLAFDAAIACGDTGSLAEAVAWYRGPLLEGCTEEWSFQELQAREQAHLIALERLAAEELASGDCARAESYLRRAEAVDPLRESSQR